jgi:hypothetical protein
MRPERVAAACLAGIAVDVAVRLRSDHPRYLLVIGLVAIASAAAAAREVWRGDVVGWVAAVAVATAVLSTVVTSRVQELPGLDGRGWSAGAVSASVLALAVLAAGLVAHRSCADAPPPRRTRS